jgi:hypothetical protein
VLDCQQNSCEIFVFRVRWESKQPFPCVAYGAEGSLRRVKPLGSRSPRSQGFERFNNLEILSEKLGRRRMAQLRTDVMRIRVMIGLINSDRKVLKLSRTSKDENHDNLTISE